MRKMTAVIVCLMLSGCRGKEALPGIIGEEEIELTAGCMFDVMSYLEIEPENALIETYGQVDCTMVGNYPLTITARSEKGNIAIHHMVVKVIGEPEIPDDERPVPRDTPTAVIAISPPETSAPPDAGEEMMEPKAEEAAIVTAAPVPDVSENENTQWNETAVSTYVIPEEPLWEETSEESWNDYPSASGYAYYPIEDYGTIASALSACQAEGETHAYYACTYIGGDHIYIYELYYED